MKKPVMNDVDHWLFAISPNSYQESKEDQDVQGGRKPQGQAVKA